MDKSAIVAAVTETLERELAIATQAALEAADSATNEESRPENKYDTRGLEASYVASAQAHYAKDLKAALQAYRNLSASEFPAGRSLALGALATTLSAHGRERFFLGPARGGLEIPSEEGPITVVTPQSPLGRSLLGKQVGERTGGPTSRTVIRIE